jgi:hypothetical protein
VELRFEISRAITAEHITVLGMADTCERAE